MKPKTLSIALAAALAAALPAFSQGYGDDRGPEYRYERDRAYDRGYDRRDYGREARVIDSRPVYATATHDECWNPRAGHYEEVRDSKRSIKGTAIGAVAGGVIGNQIDRQNRDEQDDLDRSRCRTVSEGRSDDVQGYEVRYEYRGNQYVTQLDHEPGPRLEIGHDVRDDGRPF